MFTEEFIALCKEFAKKRNDVLSEKFSDSKQLCKYTIEFYKHSLEFRYVKKESVFFKPSSLYAIIKLRKNSVIHYHLTDIIPFIEQKTFKACYYWNIESFQRLKSCFESLVSISENVISQIQQSESNEALIHEALISNYKTIYNLKETDIEFNKIEDSEDYSHLFFSSLQNSRDGFIFSRYSSFKPYALLLENRIDKALKKYEKLEQKKQLSEYEKQLIHHVSACGGQFSAFDPDCNTLASNKLMTPLSALKAFTIVFCISSFFFCGFWLICNLIISSNTILVLSEPWYTSFLCSALCSVFGAIAFFPYMPNKHLTKISRKNFSKILITKGVKKLSFIIFSISVAVSIFFAVMMMTANIRFYENSIEFDGKSYNYTQIDSVYCINSRYNVYGDKIERASYVILFNDKTSIDLDGYTSIKFTENKVLPLLKEKNIVIKTADSEKDLPWYTE